MAANKEAIAIVLDVGPNMNQAAPGEPTALQTALTAIGMILQRKMFSESKDEVTLVLFGTPETANDLADGECYENITVTRPLGIVDWQLLKYVENDIQPSNTSADFLDACVVAMDQIIRGIEGKRGFGSKRIILLSDLGGEFGDDQLADITGSLREREIEFNMIGPDLDDDDEDDDGGAAGASNGHVKEKSPQQKAGEALVRHIIAECNGESYSFNEALPMLSYFQSRQVRPTAWKCNMEVGPGLMIPINGYIKVKEAKAKTFKNVNAKDPEEPIQRSRTFHLNDEEETEVEQFETVDGHRYGSTLVPFTEDDKEAMKYRAEKCFKVLGFTKTDNVKRGSFLGDYCMSIFAEKTDESAQVALSALINALYETNMVAIVRRCYSANSAPKIGCLTPHIKANYECLYYNELPFAEDVRRFTFGTLPITDEETPINKKYKPSDEQLVAMDALIEDMDLTNVDEDDEEEEAFKPKLTFNPHLQRLYQCLQHRALNPDDPLPDLSPIIAQSLKPPKAVETKCNKSLDKLKGLFKLTDVSKKKEDQTGQNMFQDVGDGDGPAAKKVKVSEDLKGGMADIVKAKVTEVGTVTPVEDFKAILAQKDEDRFEEACKMMQKRIMQIITDSFGNQFYSKAMDCVQELRQQCITNSEPKMFNDFLTESKETLKEKSRTDFWQEIIKEKISLITKTECEDSKVTRDEADNFLSGPKEESVQVEEENNSEDADDLLDQM